MAARGLQLVLTPFSHTPAPDHHPAPDHRSAD